MCSGTLTNERPCQRPGDQARGLWDAERRRPKARHLTGDRLHGWWVDELKVEVEGGGDLSGLEAILWRAKI